MDTVLMVIHLLVAVGLITTVLLQSGKSAGISGAIAGAGESLFGRRKGMDEFFEKMTTYLAVGFMALSVVIAILV
ncbi:MAG: preprotein translocase subunit SecG [Clostridia bacterium]